MSNVFNEKYFEHLTEEDLANEQWKPIEGFPNYMISSCGRVKSLERTYYSGKYYQVKKFLPEIILKPGKTSREYLQVDLHNGSNCKSQLIHRLVAEYFIQNPENKAEVNHKFGDKTDNRVCSLEFVTREENIQHAWDNGLNEKVREANTGENNHRCKLTDEDVNEIKIKYATGNVSQKDLGEEYEVSQQQISFIINNKQRKRPTPVVQ